MPSASAPSIQASAPSSTIVTMRLPPGVPRIARPRSDSRKVGVMLESIRLPGSIPLACECTSPNALGVPRFTEKSSISLFRITPVPGGTKPEPNSVLIVCVTAARLPSLSSTEKWLVSVPSGR